MCSYCLDNSTIAHRTVTACNSNWHFHLRWKGLSCNIDQIGLNGNSLSITTSVSSECSVSTDAHIEEQLRFAERFSSHIRYGSIEQTYTRRHELDQQHPLYLCVTSPTHPHFVILTNKCAQNRSRQHYPDPIATSQAYALQPIHGLGANSFFYEQNHQI